MAEWKKIIVSGSNAHLNAITASANLPLKFTGNLTGSTSTSPLVLDSNGNIATGSAYAVQGGTDYVTGTGLTDNYVIVGNTNSDISIPDATVNFNTYGITNVGNISTNGTVGGTTTEFFNDDIAIKNNSTDDRGEIVLKGTSDLEFRNADVDSANTQVISSSISTLFLFGDANRLTPILKYHAYDSETALTDRIVFESANSTRNYAIQVKQSSDASKAEWALVNDSSTNVIHVSGSRVGIGIAADNVSGLTFAGGISGSGGAFIKDILTDESLDTDSVFTKTLVYDSATGQIAAEASNNLGGVTSVGIGTNLNNSGTSTAPVINLNTSLNALSGINATTISGSNLLVEGSGSNANNLPEDDSKVRVTFVSASNLLVQEHAQFNGSFLFSGFDFSVQNASSFSGSNVFGSGSNPGTTTHQFTGSVSITGSLDVTGPTTLGTVSTEDLTVVGYTDLDDTGIDGDLNVSGSMTIGDAAADILTVNATSTFNEDVTLSSANLNVGGAITGSTLRITGLDTATDISDANFLVISGSTNDVYEASLGTLTLEDISTSAGAGININGSVISVNSSSLAAFFTSESLHEVNGDVTFADPNSDGIFTSTIQANAVEDSMIDFIDDAAGSGIADGQILVGSGSVGSKQFFKRSLSGVIAIDSEGVTSFTEAANIDTANQASASLISSASAGDYSILLTNPTNGGVTQSLAVDGNNSDFSYNTGTNILTVGGSTFGENVTIAGTLTVSGDTVTLNTETLTVDDNFIELNSNLTAADDTSQGGGFVQDAGISINRGNQSTSSFYWDESLNRWALSQLNPAGATQVDPEALVMFVYTDTGQTEPPTPAALDDADGWFGYGSSTDASRIGSTFITSNGDIFIYA